MIYAVCGESLSYDEPGVLEYANEQEAEQDFREYIRRELQKRRYMSSIVYRQLFRTREEADAAITVTDDEVDIDDSKAFRVLDWETGFGFNF